MKTSKQYQVTIEWSAEDEAFIARVPAIKGCISHGETREEAAINIEEALEGVLLSMESRNIPIPTPDGTLSLLKSLKPILKINQLAKLIGMPPSTLSSKIDRGGPFSDDERRRIVEVTTAIMA